MRKFNFYLLVIYLVITVFYRYNELVPGERERERETHTLNKKL
jgi:hypothetical protein